MQGQKITINDVAKEAGVHRSTVSRALSGFGSVSSDSLKLVTQAALKLNYHPNTIAGALKSQRQDTWGLLCSWKCTPSSQDHLYSKIIGALIGEAAKEGLKLSIKNVEEGFCTDKESLRFCHDSQFKGLIVLSPPCEEKELEALRRLDIPVVLLAYTPRALGFNFVNINNKQGAYALTQHLLALGHQKIAYVGGNLEYSGNGRDRFEGYEDALKTAGLSLDPMLVKDKGTDSAYARAVVREFAHRPASERPTAVFCASDEMALAAIGAAKEKNLKVPGDMSICGFGDSPEAHHSSPAITTVRFPVFQSAVRAAQILKTLNQNPQASAIEVLVDAELVVRESSSSPGIYTE